MRKYSAIFMLVILVSTACAQLAPDLSPQPVSIPDATLVLTHATLIDGSGTDPITTATLVIGGERILYVGPDSQVTFPAGVEAVDLTGAYILPGFINAHVHDAYDASRLETWAQAGVTTVRDEGIISGLGKLPDLIALRDTLSTSPRYARLVSAGYMLTEPGGYGTLEVTSPEEARKAVLMELDAGVDLIKLAVESGYAEVDDLPLLSSDTLAAIVSVAHERGRLVSAHISDARYLQLLIDAGVDDLAHIPSGIVLQDMRQQLVDQDIYVVPTLTVMEANNSLQGTSYNLGKFVESGVQVALGNDYSLVPQNNFDHFELGMPMHEITLMNEAGMTPMQIIVAGTRNAAHVCGLEQELGTLEVGKLADILVLSSDPLLDLSALTRVKMVIHNGEIIRQ